VDGAPGTPGSQGAPGINGTSGPTPRLLELVNGGQYENGQDFIDYAYYYIVKHLEDTIHLKIEEDSNFFPTLLTRGSPNKLEMFRFDVIKLLQSDKVLERFVFTLREIATRWVNEYNKIFSFSKYFYDTYMITPDIFTDKIVKALLFGALKKKNPMTLRATFSTYLSMIHLIIYKEMNSDFLKRRVGSFTREDDLATNANRQSQRYFQVKDTSRSFSSKLLKNILEDNPKLLNENYYLFKRLDLGFMLENDSLEMLASRPKEIPVHDWIFYWLVLGCPSAYLLRSIYPDG
jgi:hypothetical protein